MASTITTPARTKQLLFEAITEELAPTERHLLVMWHADHLTPREIGLVLDMPEQQVISEHERLLDQLRAAAA